MSQVSNPKKEKRRIVPIQVVEEEKPTKQVHFGSFTAKGKWDAKAEKHAKRAGMEDGHSVKYQKHLEAVHGKDYVSKLNKRAVELGYEKERKKPIKKRADDSDDHGSHHEHLSDFKDYIKAFARMKTHSNGVTMYDYLKKNFDKGMYLSAKTKRFRKVK